MPVSLFIPEKVKVCSYCYSQQTTDTQGFQSLRMDAWFCHKYCHNMALLTTGEVRQSDSPDYYKHLIDSRDRVFPGNTIQRNRRWLREDIRSKKIKVIKNIFEQNPELEPEIIAE
jgi:hypothetical protein